MKAEVLTSGKKIEFNNGTLRRIYNNRVLYLFLLPAIIWFFIFGYVPMAWISMAFRDYHFNLGLLNSPWVGLKYVKEFFGYYDFWNLIRNSVFISVIKLIFSFPAPIILALMINEVKRQRFKRLVQSISYLPYFVSWAVVATMFTKLLSPNDGLINDILMSLGMKEPIYFLGEPLYFYITIVFTEVWKNVGYGTIVYLAALSSIDQGLYEAAQIDGAGRWKQMIYITLPSITFVIGLNLVLSMGGIMKAGLDQLLLFQTPATLPYSEVLETFSVRKGFLEGQFGYATLVSIFQNSISLIFMAIMNRIVKKSSDVSVW